MYTLPETLVSLRVANIRVVCERLVGDYLVVRVNDDLMGANRRGGQRCLYNVRTGVLHAAMRGLFEDPLSEEAFAEWCLDYFKAKDTDRTLEDVKQWIYLESASAKEVRKEFYSDIAKRTRISVNGLRILVALASHQVEGDKLTQGLKALGYDIEGKVTSNYLGGWVYPDNQNTEDFIRGLEQRRK